MESYKTLLQKTKKFIVYQTIQAQLSWDFQTYMPIKGGELRGTQLAIIASDMHSMITDPEIGQLLEKIKSDGNYSSLSEEQQRNIYLIERDYNRQTKLPRELVEQIAKQKVISIQTWKKAKAA